MRTNKANKAAAVFTHEGASAYPHLKPMQALRRSVLSCLLWEDGFYEDGVEIAQRVAKLSREVVPADLAALAIEARNRYHLRHAPLWLLVQLAKTGSGSSLVSATVPRVVQRADEIAELAALYWKANPDKPLSAQLKKGLAGAFENFGEYHFAKYDRDNAVKLRDVLRLVRPKPENEERAALYKRIKDRTLATPDTWEVELSAGKDKKETWERLLKENKLGYLALLRNLRNMDKVDVDRAYIKQAILERRGAQRILPFRYVAAARAAPSFEGEIDQAMIAGLNEGTKLPGRTVILVDVSGSMDAPISAKSDLRRIDAGAALASVLMGDDVRVFSFSQELVECPRRIGMAGVDAVIKSQPHGGTLLGAAVYSLNRVFNYDRLVVFTDEQSHDDVPDPKGRGYMINVASNKNGVGYGKWTHIDGMSEAVLNFIREIETQ